MSGIAALARARSRAASGARPAEPASGAKQAAEPDGEERCELCAEPVGEAHSHLVELATRNLVCACRPCALLFSQSGAGGGRYRTVPSRYRSFPALEPGTAMWESLQIPVSVAFFFFNSELDKLVGFYPSPAGATECLLELSSLAELSSSLPALGSLVPDVEAILLHVGQDRTECFLVPIDTCYELVGQLRRSWRGFDGGAEVCSAIESCFASVRARARPLVHGDRDG
jgi:hypothetical protein